MDIQVLQCNSFNQDFGRFQPRRSKSLASKMSQSVPWISPTLISKTSRTVQNSGEQCSLPVSRKNDEVLRMQSINPNGIGNDNAYESRMHVIVPSFGPQDGFSNGSVVPSSSDMIIEALKAGQAHFQRGMHHSDIMEVVCSVYKLGNRSNCSFNTILNRTLEKLVASGVVSKSYGSRAVEATYKLVNVNPVVNNTHPTMTVVGTSIKPNPQNRIRAGQCLPGSASLVTRVARTVTKRKTSKPRAVPGLSNCQSQPELIVSKPNRTKISSNISFSTSDPTLSKSFANRSGAGESLKPSGFLPNSPISGSECFNRILQENKQSSTEITPSNTIETISDFDKDVPSSCQEHFQRLANQIASIDYPESPLNELNEDFCREDSDVNLLRMNGSEDLDLNESGIFIRSKLLLDVNQ